MSELSKLHAAWMLAEKRLANTGGIAVAAAQQSAKARRANFGDALVNAYADGTLREVEPTDPQPLADDVQEVLPGQYWATIGGVESLWWLVRPADHEDITALFADKDDATRFIAAKARTDEVRIAELEAAGRGLANKLDAIKSHPSYRSVFACANNHGQQYDGPTFTAELADLRAALTPKTEGGNDAR